MDGQSINSSGQAAVTWLNINQANPINSYFDYHFCFLYRIDISKKVFHLIVKTAALAGAHVDRQWIDL